MGNKVFIGNIDYNLTEDELREALESHSEGKVVELTLKKGFAFATLETEEQCQKVIASLNGAELGSRKVFVREYEERPRPTRTFNQNRGGDRGDFQPRRPRRDFGSEEDSFEEAA